MSILFIKGGKVGVASPFQPMLGAWQKYVKYVLFALSKALLIFSCWVEKMGSSTYFSYTSASWCHRWHQQSKIRGQIYPQTMSMGMGFWWVEGLEPPIDPPLVLRDAYTKKYKMLKFKRIWNFQQQIKMWRYRQHLVPRSTFHTILAWPATSQRIREYFNHGPPCPHTILKRHVLKLVGPCFHF